MSRFDWVYDKSCKINKGWDHDLTPLLEFASVPTLGSIVKNWLLFIPRYSVQNIASISPADRLNLVAQASAVMNDLYEPDSSERIFFFEHGASHSGSLTGCGVDQAHLHGAILPFDLIAEFKKNRQTSHSAPREDFWSEIGSSEYLLCFDETRSVVDRVKAPTSQYFRKLIAENVGEHDKWDYKKYPFIENIHATLSNFHVAA